MKNKRLCDLSNKTTIIYSNILRKAEETSYELSYGIAYKIGSSYLTVTYILTKDDLTNLIITKNRGTFNYLK